MIGLLFALTSVSVVDSDFTEHLVSDRVATLVSLDIPWESGDELDAIVFPPPEPEPEPDVAVEQVEVSSNSYSNSYSSPSSPAPVQASIVKAHFYPSLETRDVGNLEYLINVHSEVLAFYDEYVGYSAPIILGHNYMGMGSKVLGLNMGDIVQVHGTSKAGRYRVVSDFVGDKYNTFVEEIDWSYDLVLQTCRYDEVTTRWVYLERV